MAPVLPGTGPSWDWDFDAVQPYFLPEEEDPWRLPPRCQLLPGPGEDIWKKFELLPPPPLSPRRRLLAPDVPPWATEQLLDGDRGPPSAQAPHSALLQSFIIRDCMWSSSFTASAKLQQVLSQRPQPDQSEGGGAGCLPAACACTSACACVDPSAVWCSVPDSPLLSQTEEEEEEEEEEQEEQEEEEEEEEEEVDVVTVDRRRAWQRSRPDSAPLVLKRSYINIHQHNYAAQQPAGKRTRAGHAHRTPPSDGEDGVERRRTHNDLERQRRNELKASFLTLRDEVPAVARNDKAAKALILKTAAEFIRQMRTDEERLLATKAELRRRGQELRRVLKRHK
uniref:BHLH domain-containing protein n=1 Tax=Sphaeramia orbicularis TaxID=375764 RepID=A0A672YUH1_9TELE